MEQFKNEMNDNNINEVDNKKNFFDINVILNIFSSLVSTEQFAQDFGRDIDLLKNVDGKGISNNDKSMTEFLKHSQRENNKINIHWNDELVFSNLIKFNTPSSQKRDLLQRTFDDCGKKKLLNNTKITQFLSDVTEEGLCLLLLNFARVNFNWKTHSVFDNIIVSVDPKNLSNTIVPLESEYKPEFVPALIMVMRCKNNKSLLTVFFDLITSRMYNQFNLFEHLTNHFTKNQFQLFDDGENTNIYKQCVYMLHVLVITSAVLVEFLEFIEHLQDVVDNFRYF